MLITTLPNELILKVYQNLTPKDLINVWVCGRQFYELAQPGIYQRISVADKSPGLVALFIRTIVGKPYLGEYVKELKYHLDYRTRHSFHFITNNEEVALRKAEHHALESTNLRTDKVRGSDFCFSLLLCLLTGLRTLHLTINVRLELEGTGQHYSVSVRPSKKFYPCLRYILFRAGTLQNLSRTTPNALINLQDITIEASEPPDFFSLDDEYDLVPFLELKSITNVTLISLAAENERKIADKKWFKITSLQLQDSSMSRHFPELLDWFPSLEHLRCTWESPGENSLITLRAVLHRRRCLELLAHYPQGMKNGNMINWSSPKCIA